MKINLAKSAGFCFGVKRAIDIALKTANSSKNIYILGDIVHNEEVAEKMRLAGIKKFRKLSRGKGRVFLIRAHGIGLDTMKQIMALGYRIVDATCPMVKEIHMLAQEMENKGNKILIIGDKKHDEVQGIAGQLKNKAIIIDGIKDIPLESIRKIKRAAVVVQSTQNSDKVLEIVRLLRCYIKELKFFNTICKPTRIRQEEIKIMPKVNDLMIIIGSRNSANTRRLYEISKSLNKRSFWINSKDEIKKEWFKDARCVGITAGASTPDSTTKEIISYIRKLR